jgi:ABC-type multidrug transport system ATPase subunit
MNTVDLPSILQVTDLHFSYPGHALFSSLSMRVSPGITMVVGGDGRGKTTLLRLLAGALPAHGGQLRINGVDSQVQTANYKAQVFWAEPRATEFDQLSVPDYFKLQRSKQTHFDDAVLAEVTEGLGLQGHGHKQLFMLSTGSKRKVFLAAAFASGAAVTLLDEPFAALDAPSIRFVLDWLSGAVGQNNRVWVMADYSAPDNLALAQTLDLGN